MVSVQKVYRGQWRLFAVSHSWKSRRVQSTSEYKDENEVCHLWIMKISWAQIWMEDYKVTEDNKIS
jgi:hypothetical protein